MSSKFMNQKTPRSIAALLIALFVIYTSPLSAQQVSAGWQAYYGCWQPVTAPSSASPAGAPGRAVCIFPADGAAAIQFVTLVDDSVVDRLRINTSGDRIPASREGCSGWESAERGRASRVYMQSEYVCEGGVQRKSSGLISMLSPVEWIDVQTVGVAGQSSVLLQRYREISVPTSIAAEVNAALRDKGLAVSSSRLAGAAVISLDDIVEASANATPATVEAWLLERRQGFVLQRKHVQYLDDKAVPASVIDVVVALSYSDAFTGELARRRLALYPSQATPVNSNRVASTEYVAPPGYIAPVDRVDRNRQYYGGSGDYFYDQSYYSPFGYFFYGSRSYQRPVQPIVIIIKEGGSGSGVNPPPSAPPPVNPPPQEPPPVRLINGRGYTNGVQTTGTTTQAPDVAGAATTNPPTTGRGAGAPPASSGGSTTSGTTSSGSSNSNGTATGRKTGSGSSSTGTAEPPATTTTPPSTPPATRTAQPRQPGTTPPPTPPPTTTTTGRGRGGG